MNENKWYVYRHIRLDKNIPFYVGIGQLTNYRRAYQKNGRNKYWNYIVKKYGYEVEVIMDGLTREEANKKENEFINLYGRVDKKNGYLCNLSDGGDGLNNPCEETRNFFSNLHKGKAYFKGGKLTEEQKDKIRKARRGTKLSDETKNKIRLLNLGKKYSEETNKKKGRPKTEEERKNLSEKLKGRRKSEETRKKMSEGRKGWIPNHEVRQKISQTLKAKYA